MSNSIIAVIGVPKSGISILGQCLRMLGMTSIDDHVQTDTSTIHGLLFQYLNHSPIMVGPLHQDWIQTPGAEQVRQRINALVSNCRDKTGALFLADPFLCRFMPLWAEAFQKAGIASRFVLMVRHPWEVAPSLARGEKLDLAKAHLLWLAYILDALRACQNQGHVLVTFDQLLADPVSTLMRMGTELDLTWPNDPWSASSSLLDFVQPSLKRHHASNLPDKDKQKFQAYERLYHEIRLGQWSGIAEGAAVNLHPLPKPAAIPPTAKGILPVKSPINEGPDLVESLLSVVGQYEKQAASRRAEQERIAAEPGPPLFAQVVFPSTREGGEIVETISLITDGWQHITLPVPEPTLLRNKPVILKPLNTNGVVQISMIKIMNSDSGNIFWSAQNTKEFDALSYKGSFIRLPNKNKLSLFITNNNPEVELPCLANLINCPICVDLWLKVSRNQNVLHKLFLVESKQTQESITSLKKQLTNKLSLMANTWDFHHLFTSRVEEFRNISQENNESLISSQTFWGKHINLYPREPVSSNIFYYGFFEIGLTSFFTDYLQRGDCMIDVGAHIGFFSMLAAELVGEKEGKVFSFEPTPSTIEVLKQNTIDYPQILIVPKLVWSSIRHIEFHDFGAKFSAYNTAVSNRLSPEEKNIATDNLIKVDTVTLDAYCKEHNIRPDLVKIDAENSEMQVLEGMTGLLENIRPLVTIEVGDVESSIQEGIPRSRELLEFVINFDYLPLNSVGGRYQFHELQDTYTYDNIIMVPIERLPIRRPFGTVAVQQGRIY